MSHESAVRFETESRIHVALPVKDLKRSIEEEVTCCFAVQDKVWATDPDGNPWEVYVVLDNEGSQHHSSQSTCCAGADVALNSLDMRRPVEVAAPRESSCCEPTCCV